MEYISVKDAAVRFGLSERRVQKLCETKRISGCKMFSGVWLIPAAATKPSDERLASVPDSADYLTLKELCSDLSISTATGRNWIRLGRLKPEYTDKKAPIFSREYASRIQAELQSGKNNALKSRRNKKYVSGNALYNSYVSEQCLAIPSLQKTLALTSDLQVELDVPTIRLLVADCALHFFSQKYNSPSKDRKNLLRQFINGNVSFGDYDVLIKDLIGSYDFAKNILQSYPLLFDATYTYEPDEDILGLIYISCANIQNRKATGSYYTSTRVVRRLIRKLGMAEPGRILDPCCGTGNFLLQLPDSVTFDSVYGNDLDETSIKIARINMALKYGASVSKIFEHITVRNFLTDYPYSDFQFIIGNPPWGYDYSDEEKRDLATRFSSASGKNIESYDVFIEQAFQHLSDGGHLAYVLPEALLNVKAHTDIRTVILQNSSIKNLDYLGNAFDGVQCPCIILDLQKKQDGFSTKGMKVTVGEDTFSIQTERSTTAERFCFTTTDAEYRVLSKIMAVENAAFLAGNADFALGIVTGNNKEFISDQKTRWNEMILKGSDIRKFHINPTTNYITFRPESFQQVAPTELYRAKEKLLYRFICNQFVFAYDDKQTLSLNSCNIVIPRIPGAKMKYVLAILNSRVAQFIFKREFNSVKVLRSHIESIPIPLVDEGTQDEIVRLTEKLIAGATESTEAQEATRAAAGNEAPEGASATSRIYDEIDALVSDLFHLNSRDRSTIRKALAGDNLFLE